MHLILEAHSVVRAVAEGLVRRMAAAAKREPGPTPQPEGVTFRVHNLEIALDSKRAIGQRGDLGRWHQLLQLRKRLLLEIAKALRKQPSPRTQAGRTRPGGAFADFLEAAASHVIDEAVQLDVAREKRILANAAELSEQICSQI